MTIDKGVSVNSLFSKFLSYLHTYHNNAVIIISKSLLLSLFRFNFHTMETSRNPWIMFLPILFISLFYTTGSLSQTSSAIRLKLARAGLKREVRMRAGKAFKIAVFADLHFGEDAWTNWGPLQDVNSIKVMNTVLDYETPGQNKVTIYYHLFPFLTLNS